MPRRDADFVAFFGRKKLYQPIQATVIQAIPPRLTIISVDMARHGRTRSPSPFLGADVETFGRRRHDASAASYSVEPLLSSLVSADFRPFISAQSALISVTASGDAFIDFLHSGSSRPCHASTKSLIGAIVMTLRYE